MKTIILILSTLLVLFSFQNCEIPEELLRDIQENSDSFYLEKEPLQISFLTTKELDTINPSPTLYTIANFSEDTISIDDEYKALNAVNIVPDNSEAEIVVPLQNKAEILKLLMETEFNKATRPDELLCALMYQYPWAVITLQNGDNITLFKGPNFCQTDYFISPNDVKAFEELESEIKGQIQN